MSNLNPTTLHRASGTGPTFVYHPSFEEPGAEARYAGAGPEDTSTAGHMIDEVTRETTKRMHYMAWRVHAAKRPKEAQRWKQRYYAMRDRVVLGNRKLVYRAVSKRMASSPIADDMIGECHIVLIQAVAAYNPWLGVRFSTYAFTCLMRALSRLGQRRAADRLAHALSLDALAVSDSRESDLERASSDSLRLDEYFQEGHGLLSPREKMVLRRRFCLAEGMEPGTLEQVGQEMGLSKERVRQVQAMALSKLREALTESAVTS